MSKSNFVYWLPALLIALNGCAASDVTGVGYAPTATMGAFTYGNSQQALDSSAIATVRAVFTNDKTSFITNGSATTSAPPTGVTIASTGTANCSLLVVYSAGNTGASFDLSGCLGDGTISINTAAAAGISATNQYSLASNVAVLNVINTPPAVSPGGFNEQLTTTTANGGNVFTVQFDHRVKTFSADNSGGEFTLSATCGAIAPTMVISQNDSGAGSLVTATLAASPCASGSGFTVNAHLNLNLVQNLAGDPGAANPALTQTYTIP